VSGVSVSVSVGVSVNVSVSVSISISASVSVSVSISISVGDSSAPPTSVSYFCLECSGSLAITCHCTEERYHWQECTYCVLLYKGEGGA
jgi:hypothetical protein